MYKLYPIFIFLTLCPSFFYSQNSLKVDFQFVNFGADNEDHIKKYQGILEHKQSYFISTEIKYTKTDSNGIILEYKNNGKFSDEYVFSKNSKLNSPKGMCIVREILFVADIDRIVAFDIETGNFKYQINFSNFSQSIYDLVKINDSTIIISATDKGALFKLNINNKEICELGIKIIGVTALYYEDYDSTLFCGSIGDKKINGQILKINLKSGICAVLNKNA